jgi:16S rRNA (cytidine1402-2'-O)-methyltransferase
MDAEKSEPDNDALKPGLYLVATPIGNLGDITLRALEVLRGVDRIACEDTRQTQKLLNHFQINTPTESCHEFNEPLRAVAFVEAIRAGQRIAVVTDAGMPGISDPGARLAAAAIAAGLPVIPIPGANAAVSALVASGLPTEEFVFLGFLPEKAGARRTRLETLARELAGSGRTMVFYEAPHRILETLQDVEAVFPTESRVVVARELTKMHEEFLRGTASEVRGELAGRDRVRGEITLLIEAPPAERTEADPSRTISAQIAELQTREGIDEKEALKRLARETRRAKSDLYRELQRERASGVRKKH